MEIKENQIDLLAFIEKNQDFLNMSIKMWIVNEQVLNHERQKVNNFVVMLSNKHFINKVEVQYLDDKNQVRGARDVISEGVLKALNQMFDALEGKEAHK
jgi:hypothetical protein